MAGRIRLWRFCRNNFNGYDCISHELLVAKLECYGLDELSLKLILEYLSNRKQRTKIGSSFSNWFDISVGVPQCSILGSLLFNTFINELINLKIDLKNVSYWFQVNSLKANPGKFQFMILRTKRIIHLF